MIQYSHLRASGDRRIECSKAATRTRNRTIRIAWVSDLASPSPKPRAGSGSEQTMSHAHHVKLTITHGVRTHAHSPVRAQRARKQMSATAIATSAIP